MPFSLIFNLPFLLMFFGSMLWKYNKESIEYLLFVDSWLEKKLDREINTEALIDYMSRTAGVIFLVIGAVFAGILWAPIYFLMAYGVASLLKDVHEKYITAFSRKSY